MLAFTIDIGSNLRLLGVLLVVAVLVIQWWSFRLKGRR